MSAPTATPSAPAPEPPAKPDPIRPPAPAVAFRLPGLAQSLWRTAWSTPARQASVFTAFQFGAAQALRLVSNLALTRLLFPEAFGLMTMVQVVMAALAMFSDIGLGPSIIQHKRGDEPPFYNSAWSMQVIRGFILWAIAVAIAWPAAATFDMPELMILLPLVGVSAAISGFDSTAFWSARRHLRLGRVVTLELASQLLSILAMVLLAGLFYLNPAAATAAAARALEYLPAQFTAGMDPAKLAGVMCLALGTLLAPVSRAIMSHTLLDRRFANLLQWDRDAAREIFHFGKWIFISTFLTFFAARMDVLIVGRLLGDRVLGVYGIGQTMALMLPNAVLSLAGAVLFPHFSKVVRERPGELKDTVLRVRRTLLLPTTIAMAVLVLGGHWIVRLLYDARYQEAGWILQILAAGAPAVLVSATYGNAMLALGRSREIVVLLVPQICFLTAGSLIGYHLAPELWTGGALGFLSGPAPTWAPVAGLVTGFAITEWLNYPIVLWRARKYGVANPGLDLKVFAIAAGAAAVSFVLFR